MTNNNAFSIREKTKDVLNRFLGQEVIISQEIKPNEKGQVSFYDTYWSAICLDNIIIPKDEIVEVIGIIEPITLIVKPKQTLIDANSIFENKNNKIFLKELLLFDIFNSLRQRHDFPLGIEDYLIVVKSIKAGFGINNRQALEQLCCTLWAKSEDESRLIKKLFEQMWIQVEDYIPDEIETESTSNKEDISDNFEPKTSSELSTTKTIPEIEETPKITLEENEPVQVVKAIRTHNQETSFNRLRYSLLNDYFPVTKRQMKQSWRYLRHLVREGIPVELDIEKTVDKIGREGLLIEPVLMPRKINRTDLILMVDQEGSMIPFHGLSRQLIETAERGGKLRQTRVFYFHDYVDKYIYRHPALLNAQKLEEMLAEVGERAIILIISDGGAARGKFEEERVQQTQLWINQLQSSVKYVAWLNPMPSDSWQHTTASEIAQMLPMFEMSREGMNTAINVLRGRHIMINQYQSL